MVSPEADRRLHPFPFDVPLVELRRRRSAKWTMFAPDVLPLPVAEMDVRLAPPISAALQTAIDASDTGYAGDPSEVIEAFSGFGARRWNWQIDPDDVRLCGDVAVGVTDVLRRVAVPGERVLIMPPVYPRFYAWLRETGLHPVEAPLREVQDGGRLDFESIAAALGSGVRVVMLCNPQNPTGRVHNAAELRALAELAVAHGAVVLSDEIHAPMAYRTAEFSPYLSLGDAARATGIVFTGASKTWNIPGLKCSLIVAASDARDRPRKSLPPKGAWGVGQFGLLASTAAFAHGDAWLDRLTAALKSNVLLLRELLAHHIPQITMPEPRAGYLAWLDCSALGLEVEPASFFLERGQVALSAGRDFGPPGAGHARLNFACSTDVLEEALARMARALAFAQP